MRKHALIPWPTALQIEGKVIDFSQTRSKIVANSSSESAYSIRDLYQAMLAVEGSIELIQTFCTLIEPEELKYILNTQLMAHEDLDESSIFIKNYKSSVKQLSGLKNLQDNDICKQELSSDQFYLALNEQIRNSKHPKHFLLMILEKSISFIRDSNFHQAVIYTCPLQSLRTLILLILWDDLQGYESRVQLMNFGSSNSIGEQVIAITEEFNVSLIFADILGKLVGIEPNLVYEIIKSKCWIQFITKHPDSLKQIARQHEALIKSISEQIDLVHANNRLREELLWDTALYKAFISIKIMWETLNTEINKSNKKETRAKLDKAIDMVNEQLESVKAGGKQHQKMHYFKLYQACIEILVTLVLGSIRSPGYMIHENDRDCSIQIFNFLIKHLNSEFEAGSRLQRLGRLLTLHLRGFLTIQRPLQSIIKSDHRDKMADFIIKPGFEVIYELLKVGDFDQAGEITDFYEKEQGVDLESFRDECMKLRLLNQNSQETEAQFESVALNSVDLAKDLSKIEGYCIQHPYLGNLIEEIRNYLKERQHQPITFSDVMLDTRVIQHSMIGTSTMLQAQHQQSSPSPITEQRESKTKIVTGQQQKQALINLIETNNKNIASLSLAITDYLQVTISPTLDPSQYLNVFLTYLGEVLSLIKLPNKRMLDPISFTPNQLLRILIQQVPSYTPGNSNKLSTLCHLMHLDRLKFYSLIKIEQYNTFIDAMLETLRCQNEKCMNEQKLLMICDRKKYKAELGVEAERIIECDDDKRQEVSQARQVQKEDQKVVTESKNGIATIKNERVSEFLRKQRVKLEQQRKPEVLVQQEKAYFRNIDPQKFLVKDIQFLQKDEIKDRDVLNLLYQHELISPQQEIGSWKEVIQEEGFIDRLIHSTLAISKLRQVLEVLKLQSSNDLIPRHAFHLFTTSTLLLSDILLDSNLTPRELLFLYSLLHSSNSFHLAHSLFIYQLPNIEGPCIQTITLYLNLLAITSPGYFNITTDVESLISHLFERLEITHIKSILEHYPEVISSDNIRQCFRERVFQEPQRVEELCQLLDLVEEKEQFIMEVINNENESRSDRKVKSYLKARYFP
ncbi:hypothetical protein FGO68_gene10133 [Halteria grandinella]|uniref:Uncharacterized protein n=1 Tax=Halteria grandinella TaxID=5974 RepID=A0A8J8P5I2_HALGN|nr:hypothetical protein FGO68_gene10133 [Halteria grandinella]